MAEALDCGAILLLRIALLARTLTRFKVYVFGSLLRGLFGFFLYYLLYLNKHELRRCSLWVSLSLFSLQFLLRDFVSESEFDGV